MDIVFRHDDGVKSVAKFSTNSFLCKYMKVMSQTNVVTFFSCVLLSAVVSTFELQWFFCIFSTNELVFIFDLGRNLTKKTHLWNAKNQKIVFLNWFADIIQFNYKLDLPLYGFYIQKSFKWCINKQLTARLGVTFSGSQILGTKGRGVSQNQMLSTELFNNKLLTNFSVGILIHSEK